MGRKSQRPHSALRVLGGADGRFCCASRVGKFGNGKGGGCSVENSGLRNFVLAISEDDLKTSVTCQDRLRPRRGKRGAHPLASCPPDVHNRCRSS